MKNEELADEVLNAAAATVDGFTLELRGRIMSAIQKARQEEREAANLQIDELKDLLGRAKRLLSVCSFDAKEDIEDLDKIHGYSE